MALFSSPPKPEKSIGFIRSDDSDPVTLFEILLHIMAEGLVMDHGTPPSYHTTESIMQLDPYFRSIGFHVEVEQFPKTPRDPYGKYYCRTIFRTPSNAALFEAKNLESSYHFLVNGDAYDENINIQQLDQLFTILESQNDVYTVKFHSLPDTQ